MRHLSRRSCDCKESHAACNESSRIFALGRRDCVSLPSRSRSGLLWSAATCSLNWCDSPLGLGASCERRGGARRGAPAPSLFPCRLYGFGGAFVPARRSASRRQFGARHAAGRGMGRQMPGMVRASGIGMPPRKRRHAMTVAASVPALYRRPAMATRGRRGDRSALRRARLSRRLQALDQHEVAALALFLGVLFFAVVAAVLLVRTRDRLGARARARRRRGVGAQRRDRAALRPAALRAAGGGALAPQRRAGDHRRSLADRREPSAATRS